ncbi:hypothetical protein NBRC111894_2025 [Sporolactobacillus inulinus]|uniref:Uncharacterized protein n=1 Tax=Sporolactobacillus inulinus TaxID=2078 RepID=A0A4Y1ZC08_9BACL|nr:hypothetical protein NBRC111894_2025 [Sporolactobacillus inulinus]
MTKRRQTIKISNGRSGAGACKPAPRAYINKRGAVPDLDRALTL